MNEPNNPENRPSGNIRRLIWLYFWLLLLEGALRKWVVPQLSNPLLIVRDPVVLLVYFLAFRAAGFSAQRLDLSLSASSRSCLVRAQFPCALALSAADSHRFGVRLRFPLRFPSSAADFCHARRVFRPEDVKRIGWWTLLVLVPMALLMVGAIPRGARRVSQSNRQRRGRNDGRGVGKSANGRDIFVRHRGGSLLLLWRPAF